MLKDFYILWSTLVQSTQLCFVILANVSLINLHIVSHNKVSSLSAVEKVATVL